MRFPTSDRRTAGRAIFGVVAVLGLVAGTSGQTSRPQAPAATGIRLEDVTWPMAEQRLRSDAVVMLPLGAGAQQHGPHLKLRHDLAVAEYLTRRILEVSDVIATPPLPYHYFPAFLEYPGSTSLALSTARDLTADVVRSVARHGPRRFYVLNTGYSTAQPLLESAKLLAAEGILLRYTDMQAVLDASRAIQRQPGGNHADELETSMMLYIDPSAVDMRAAVRDFSPATTTPFALTRQEGGRGTYSPSGVWGDATLATRDKGRVLVEGLVRGISDDIEEVRRAPLPAATGAAPPRQTPAGTVRAAEPGAASGECLAGDDRAIRAIGPGFSLAWTNQDALRLAAMWSPGGDMAHPDGYVEGTAEIIRQNRAYLFSQPGYRYSRHSLTIGTIRCISPDVAIADGKWELRGVTDTKGQPAPPAEGLCTLVLKRRGGWSIEAWRYTVKPLQTTPQPLLQRPGFPGSIK